MSLCLAVGILVCDRTSHKLLTAARAQTVDTSPDPCSNPAGERTVYGRNVGVTYGDVVTASLRLRGVMVGKEYVPSVELEGNVALAAASVSPEEGTPVTGVLVGDAVTSNGVLVGDAATTTDEEGPGDGDTPCVNGVLVGDALNVMNGVLVGDAVTADGGTLFGENMRVVDGVLKGDNLRLVGATVRGKGIAIRGAVMTPVAP
ncbi:MAG TPA: hypothetical protein VD968_18800 [Pyrinomonadaceae bacterium]|nr:hypothetical protein [Pyrinomonadaceae bacterium]